MNTFQKWPSIELLHNVNKNCQRLGIKPVVRYSSKIKLHGTNAGIQILASGEVLAQSRSKIIAKDDDNAGFAAWVDHNREFFSELALPESFTIFGEWCGKGIQKGTAISSIDRKIFAIFAIQINNSGNIITDPKKIELFFKPHPDIYLLPFEKERIILDFENPISMSKSAELLSKMVEDVEVEDPWVKRIFGISGIGEGLVFYPTLFTASNPESPDHSLEFTFKAKGEKHQAVKTKTIVPLEPSKVESIQEFVHLMLPEARLEQGVHEACDGDFDETKTGLFLAWISKDVQKESADELEASGLEWKAVYKPLTNYAREWFQRKVRTI